MKKGTAIGLGIIAILGLWVFEKHRTRAEREEILELDADCPGDTFEEQYTQRPLPELRPEFRNGELPGWQLPVDPLVRLHEAEAEIMARWR